MRIGLAQLDMGFENKALAKKLCEEMICSAANQQVDLLIFPEMTLTGFTMKTNELAEHFEDSETIDFFKKNAQLHKLAICFGLPIVKFDKAENHCIIISAEGKILVDYTKIHPFSFGTEADYYTGGDTLTSCTINGVVTTPFICYDLRFPEIFQASSEKSLLLIVIANWPRPRREHWITLLKARAIENQAFVVGVNRAGTGGGLDYAGDSMAVSPLGDVLAHSDEGHSLTVVNISPEDAQKYRNNFPLKADRKPQLYSKFLENFKN
ncbi:nitrilase-related carbon-nitrogen hydrolase [Anaerotignum sp.]|uniref:nitrilase-related carbon-nitrogen hydrolase n=1 Tax=Anaerotignum sp. TaxID=2039241 RepID=UPI0028A7CED5|nr:nitrilase-related carbon-nitrogen hydrolase [Anaerotignum sp.]